MSGKPIVLVTGATGSQGGAVVSELLKSDTVAVRILTRSATSEKALALKAKGAEVVQGDMFDGASLKTALTGVDRAFLVTDYQLKGVEGETESGNLFVDQAAAAGVKHLVFSSVGSAGSSTGIPHFESKFKVEQHLRASSIPSWTILRPVAFMENFPAAGGAQRFMTLGMFDAALQGKSIQLVAVQDIGFFAAQALEKPEEWKGKVVELAGDDVTIAQMKAAYEKVEGGKPWEIPLPKIALKAMLPTEVFLMFTVRTLSSLHSSRADWRCVQWFGEKGYNADIAWCRKTNPGMLNFEEWLRTKQA
ncbi:NAD(P)-binding protein [Calocera viscosa TUFC12733]|uniref:NAD(P)-binding protein n=1 Tax=Calocera viscosa (strain TUFC12733) TaxID=1330018 RepID=A0A167HFT2_CALVF|nr:NAD(P)-binding protein [Calocera viscosa TUFC12733]